MNRRLLLAVPIVVLALVIGVRAAIAEPPAPPASVGALAVAAAGFTYQGRLTDGGSPANGTYDFRFILYGADVGGSQIGSTVTAVDVAVANGIFTVQLDFGAGAFAGDAAWLEIAVRAGTSTGSYTILTPRQPVSPVPYAVYAQTAGNVPTYAAGSGLTLSGSTFALDTGYADARYWKQSGNAGVTPGTNLLGTMTNVSLTLVVSNTAALRLEPNAASPNVIGGSSANSVASGVFGATIGGGGDSTYSNRVAYSFGTVGGGAGNTASAWEATGGGGGGNIGSGSGATIGGGYSNSGSGYVATIGGGDHNAASGSRATVGGGYVNTASGDYTTVSGGDGNTASGWGATISGGGTNTTSGQTATVGGGEDNTASGYVATVGGGQGNSAGGTNATIGGGYGNRAFESGATIAGGWGNVVGNGNSDTTNAAYTTVGGGNSNKAGSTYATVGGGYQNTASRMDATVGGGYQNTASSSDATVGGGYQNTASGWAAVVPGGWLNVAQGDNSLAAGTWAKANHHGTFVWGDSTAADIASTGQDQFVVRASGGTYFYSNGTATTGVRLSAGSGSWSSLSDRNLKENAVPVDPRDLLARLQTVPIDTWSYRDQGSTVRHIGPMAQDFAAAFGVGEDDRHIDTVDADGVALAAIQGLYQEVQQQDAAIAAIAGLTRQVNDLQAENRALRSDLDDIKRRVAAVEAEGTGGAGRADMSLVGGWGAPALVLAGLAGHYALRRARRDGRP